MTADELGITGELGETIRDDLPRVERDGPLPALYKYSAELFRQLDPSEVPVRFRKYQTPMRWVRSVKHPDGGHWMTEQAFARVLAVVTGPGLS